jgi:hypothetical protein
MIVSAVGIAVRERTPRGFAIRKAMEHAVKQAVADGVNDDDEIKRRILAARDIARKAFAAAESAPIDKGSRVRAILRRIAAAAGMA